MIIKMMKMMILMIDDSYDDHHGNSTVVLMAIIYNNTKLEKENNRDGLQQTQLYLSANHGITDENEEISDHGAGTHYIVNTWDLPADSGEVCTEQAS